MTRHGAREATYTDLIIEENRGFTKTEDAVKAAGRDPLSVLDKGEEEAGF